MTFWEYKWSEFHQSLLFHLAWFRSGGLISKFPKLPGRIQRLGVIGGTVYIIIVLENNQSAVFFQNHLVGIPFLPAVQNRHSSKWRRDACILHPGHYSGFINWYIFWNNCLNRANHSEWMAYGFERVVHHTRILCVTNPRVREFSSTRIREYWETPNQLQSIGTQITDNETNKHLLRFCLIYYKKSKTHHPVIYRLSSNIIVVEHNEVRDKVS